MNRLGESFIDNEGLLLREFGFKSDKGTIELDSATFMTFYHYTHEDKLDQIFSPHSGLLARRPVTCPNVPERFKDCFLTEGFLERLPNWVTNCPYFSDLGYELMRKYIGNTLLEIKLPVGDFNIYIADYAHVLECKSADIRGKTELNLEYDCSSGIEVTQAYVNSYIPEKEYNSGHVAPIVQVLRKGEGIVVPSKYISVSKVQPLK
ncbi:MAG: hypothetical protein ACQEXX_12760 [Bacillota bacterium]